jgi:Rrf2 family protein
MKLTKQLQYGILFCLYLSRAGRATVKAASENMSISKLFLDRIANKLKRHGIIKGFKGPGGGFELLEDARMIYIFRALGTVGILSNKESGEYVSGCPEKRALTHYAMNLGLALNPLLNRKVISVMKEVVANEVAHLANANTRMWEN